MPFAGKRDQLRVLQSLHHRQHQVGFAQLLAEQHQLGLEEQFRLAGDRRHLRVDGVAVRPVAGRAQLDSFLRKNKKRKKGGEQESPPPLAERQLHYLAASFFAGALGRW
jgi:hypothetical protein